MNDPYVMKAWKRSYEGAEDLKFLADGSSEFTKALDLQLDLSEKGLGFRSRRYSLLVDDLGDVLIGYLEIISFSMFC